MTPRRLLQRATGQLQSAGCTTPRLDAEILLCHQLDKTRSWLVAHADDELARDAVDAFEILLARRLQREPVAYITGEREFWSRPFHVTPDVLIPRPETEHLIEAVLTHFPDREGAWRFCDIGTGSGCIAATLACEYPAAQIVATDISPTSLAVARGNAERHGVVQRIAFRQGDLLAALAAGDGPFDAIVSNPPYVAEEEIPGLEAELAHEPRHALSDGGDGLSLLRGLLTQSAAHLTPQGLLIVETGLCGLPDDVGGMHLQERIIDLAGMLRGGIYGR